MPTTQTHQVKLGELSLAENVAFQMTSSPMVAGLPTLTPGAGSEYRTPDRNTSLPSHAGTVVCMHRMHVSALMR
jgi:hypothetical protein